MEIRTAVLADIPRLQEIYDQLFEEAAAMQPAHFQPTRQSEAFLKETIESDKSDLLVAQEDIILGFALVKEAETPPYDCMVPHRFAHLMDLCVDFTHRKHGTGKLLLDAVRSWARARQLDYLELSALAQNMGAIHFYREQGFTEAMKVMQAEL